MLRAEEKQRRHTNVEIGIIIAIILMIFALALKDGKAALLIKELARLALTAVGLGLVMLAALCRPRRLAAA
jgi:hypothetical protein